MGNHLYLIIDTTGGSAPPYWDPPYEHVFNPFPKCIPICKYWYSLNYELSEQKQGKTLVFKLRSYRKKYPHLNRIFPQCVPIRKYW